MLKVECLNNSLWNHLDKTIVVSIVQRLEIDRMRQKRDTPQGLPLQVWSEMGTKEVAYLSFPPSFLEGLLTTEHPPLANCQKGAAVSPMTGSWTRQGLAARALHPFFSLITYCLRGVPTGCSGPSCCWLKGLGQEAFENSGIFRKSVDSHLPKQPVSFIWHLLLFSQELLHLL